MYNNDIMEYKEKINRVLYSDKKENEIIVGGQGKVMISCPHSVIHYRNGIKKYAEEDTVILAHLLHNELNIPYIYKVKSDNEDANYDKQSIYRDKLAKYIEQNDIKLLLDFHELNPERKEIVNIGIAHGENILNENIVNILIRNLSLAEIGMISIDEPYSASGKSVISSYIHNKCNIDCVQIEFNSGLFQKDVSNFEKMKNIFILIIKELIGVL